MIAEESLTIPGAFDGLDWMHAAHLGEHHQIRMHCKCPFCATPWAFDVTERPGVIEKNPDPVKLGLSLLCGKCKAFRRILYVCRDGNQRVLWFSPFFGEREQRSAWKNLRDGMFRGDSIAFVVSQDKGPWLETERTRPTGRDRRLIDEADDAMRTILGPLRGQGRNSMDPKEAQAAGWGNCNGAPWVPEVPIDLRGKLQPSWGRMATGQDRDDD